MKMKRITRIVIICAFLLTSLGVVPSLAAPFPPMPPALFLPTLIQQPSTVTVSGAVMDADRYPVANVVITDIHGATTTTDLNGSYALQVQPGLNTLTATRSGYSIEPLSINAAANLTAVNFSAQVGCGSIVTNEMLNADMGGWDFLSDQEDVVPGIDSTFVANSPPSSGRVGINTGVDSNIASTTRARSQVYHIPSDADAVFLGIWINLVDTGVGENDRAFIDLLDADNNIITTLYTVPRDSVSAWTFLEFGLDAYTDRSVKIQVRVLNDGGAFSATLYFDDVTLIICNTHCDSQIINGGFETTDGWLYNQEAIINPWYNPGPPPPHSGLFSMQTGIPVSGTLSILTGLNYFNLESSSEVWQRNIDLPDGSGAMLTFWIYRTRLEGVPPPVPVPPADFSLRSAVPELAGSISRVPAAITATPPEDWTYVYILDDHRDFLAKPFWQRATNDNAWIRYDFDISDFMGQQIELLFGTYNDGKGGPAAMFIDDVEVGTCP